MIDSGSFTGPVLVTAAYFVLWYVLLFRQTRTKRRLSAEYKARNQSFDRYFGQDRQMLAADRAAANTHEQMVPFERALVARCRGFSLGRDDSRCALCSFARFIPCYLEMSSTRCNPSGF